ncbi:tyrosine-protein phosphatase [Streptomyces profundus]|uniref:tyrosine-protein phosphatase n=1 Tax=Streptomyces profundus TaxID=2867410 RepID=UPI001D16151E|nr:tyrosine-protein phosphatase [Streptomyces sp. MA3_2.13]UED87663.1 tyrosine-protein phosphatase [Streptomyces sp. MA3_2.13]
MTEPSTEPALDAIRNFRDVGGLPTTDGRVVRRGRLFRSGHLAHATEADQAFLNSLGLHTVFDFRNAADQALDGLDVPLDGVRNVNIPLTDPSEGDAFWALVRQGDVTRLRRALADGQGIRQMCGSYRQIIRTRAEEQGRVLRALAAGDMPALLHCAAGKDRAGLTVAVVLLAVGVSRETIAEDYLKSNAAHRRYQLRRADSGEEKPRTALDQEIQDLLAPMFDARLEYLTTAFDTIDQDWGGTDPYLTGALGLTPAHRARLRAALLAPAA